MAEGASRSCPRCGHVRSEEARAPAWQCPSCGIAYAKYAGYLERRRRAADLFRPRGDADPAPPVSLDGSLWALLGANALTLAVALWQGWDPRYLMLVYWAQSVVIGVSNVFRMLALDRFSTENFRVNGRAVEPTPATKRQTAAFFAMHYGLFHALYLAFLVSEGDGPALIDGWFGLCAVLFAANHLYSHRYNVAIDRRGTPNIGTLMFTPYLRIVPMHLTLIFGGLFGGFGLVLFVAMKTLADVAMHLVEHQQLRKRRQEAVARSPG